VEEPQYNVSVYENKPVIKRRTDKGERITKELVYHYVCPKCDRDVVEIHRWAVNAAGNIAKREREQLIGISACEYMFNSVNNRKAKTVEYKDTIHSKGIPLRYGKAINDETVRMRYINEAGYDGEKIETKVKIFS
jgi:hypothetical protein